MEENQKAYQTARDALAHWQSDIQENYYARDPDYIHTLQFQFGKDFARIDPELKQFGEAVAKQLEPLVNENNLALNLPRLDSYNAIGERIDCVRHHPSYVQAGDIIYGSSLLAKMAEPGGLSACLSFLFLSSQAGEAGHNCPIACSAGIIRVLEKTSDVPNRDFYLKKLTASSFQSNFTGAQFLTEIQGGSDVGLNATFAKQNKDGTWQIHGEKWFCSNANANLIFVTARYDTNLTGTKGLGLFLVPAEWEQRKNHYQLRRLKDKIGTRSMATAEIDFNGAFAWPVGKLEDGFHLVMDNVLHLSRLFNSVCVLGMARRAYTIARSYAMHRIAFSHPIIDYPLVKEHLARIKAENTAMVAAIFATAKMQDQFDTNKTPDNNTKLLLRLLVNIQKYLSAHWSVEHIHHTLDVLAGNGAIESFSPIPRLLRDCIVCENWEGTHNVLRAQVHKDILKYHIDQIFIEFLKKKIDTLDKNNAYNNLLLDEVQRLEDELQSFRQLDPDLQALQIRLIVDRMAILYCACMLLFEALDQAKTSSSHTKMDCLQYFWLLHFEKNKKYDKQYLELISCL